MATQSSQEFVPIKEVRDGVIILKDGSMRAILMTSSINFALKSTDEQQSIIFQFQNFMNTLDFSIQISIQSRRLDIRPYIALLENRQREQTNDLMKIQTKEYIEFVRTFTSNTNIMTKSFFIVIPYTPAKMSIGKKGLFKKEKDRSRKESTENFEENRIQLEQRVSIVEQGITRTGVRAVRLGTEEVIEIFYKLFNPGDVEKPIPLE
ncbi:hypothetical protein GW764_00740 [Candidatus Parcubacteria bacterium]|nr:hypothetical protein [Candidatus Parcubacteria bacterium]